MAEFDEIVIYTDGSCHGNPGVGGIGAVLIRADGERKEISEGYANTTNNRMEMLAVICALDSLTQTYKAVVVRSDSSYVVNAFNQKWIEKWHKNGWRTANKKPVENRDLWERLVPLVMAHKVKFEWVKGHSADANNARADELANAGADSPDKMADVGYQKGAGELL